MLVTIIVDVFRAFTTASYVLAQEPSLYILTEKDQVITQLAQQYIFPVAIGKPERGTNREFYKIPNSPTRTSELSLEGHTILHRTAAGAKGVIEAKEADLVLAAGFVNAAATVQYIQKLSNPEITIRPMGHEGTAPSLEDDLCAQYLQALLDEKPFDLNPYKENLKNGSGSYFFKEEQWEYPTEDFTRCLEVDRFDFAIEAKLQGEYAILTRCTSLS